MIAVIFSALILFIILILLPVKLYISYTNGEISLKIKMLFEIKLPSKKRASSSVAEETEKKVTEKAVKLTERINYLKKAFPIAIRLSRKLITCELFEVNIITGTSDAALTAISCGALWAVIYNLIGVFGLVVNLKKHSCNISPNYTECTFKASGKCIISTRIAYIIFIAAVLNPARVRRNKNERTASNQ